MNRHRVLKKRCIKKHNVQFKKGQCAWCKTLVTDKRRTWCSDTCRDHFQLRSDWEIASKYAYERANGHCQKCGINFQELFQAVLSTLDTVPNSLHISEVDHILPVIEGGDNEPENLRALCIYCHKEETKALKKRLKGN